MRRLLVIGFDAMDAGLVRHWADADVLPTFRDFLNSSAWCTFDIPPQYSSGMVWPSINTGLPPQEHAAGFGTQLVAGRYRLQPRPPHVVRGEPFWKAFTECGRRVVVADVPFSRIVPEYAQKQFWGWGQHDWTGDPASYPCDLLSDLQRRFGKYPLRYSMDYLPQTQSLRELREHLSLAISRRAEILRSLLTPDAWDLFYAAFPESHIAGHMFWHLNDRDHPDHLAEQRGEIGNALKDTYIQLDKALAGLLHGIGQDTTKVVFFSHGMGPNYHGDHLFPQMLRRFNATLGDPATADEEASVMERSWASIASALPEALRRAVKMRVPLQLRRWLSAKRAENPSRWRNTSSFAIPRLDGFSAVRVNLRGREPQGRIEPGEDYRAYLSQLEAEIRSWTNGETGEPAVERIYRADEDYSLSTAAPELMIWWNKATPIRVLRSQKLGSVSGKLMEQRSGEHVMRSLFSVQSAGIRHGRKLVIGMNPTDIAPTLCDLAGVTPSKGLRGCSRWDELRE